MCPQTVKRSQQAHTCPRYSTDMLFTSNRSFPLLPALPFCPFSGRFRERSKEPSKSVAGPVLTAGSARRNDQQRLSELADSRQTTRDDLIVFLSSDTPVWSFCHMHCFSFLFSLWNRVPPTRTITQRNVPYIRNRQASKFLFRIIFNRITFDSCSARFHRAFM